MLMALLLPDPCDPHCPQEFKKAARVALGEVRQPASGDEDLRKALLWFIGSFASWDMAAHRVYLNVARGLVVMVPNVLPPNSANDRGVAGVGSPRFSGG
jgi:hypothetical protein